MPHDPYAILHALLRAEAARDAQKPNPDATRPPAPDEGRYTSSRPSPLASPWSPRGSADATSPPGSAERPSRAPGRPSLEPVENPVPAARPTGRGGPSRRGTG